MALGSDCWWWTARLNHNGYPLINIWRDGRVRTFRAHRVAYEEWVGPIPDGMTIDHTCEVSWCINPAHLIPLTNEVNAGMHKSKMKF
jgi:hypothetical protein